MATAKKVEIPQPKFTVELSLSQEEAGALYAVSGRICGTPETSRRKHFDNIRLALRSVGISSDDNDISVSQRAIYFNDSI